MNLLIYNPDTDYALASGSPFYTLPASVKKLISASPYMAAAWGTDRDCILLPDWIDSSDFKPVFQQRDASFRVLTDTDLKNSPDIQTNITSIKPWGWNPSLKHRLLSAGLSEDLLPSDQQIQEIRRLSHRSLTIDFNRELQQPYVPVLIHSEEEGIEYWKNNPGCWFKAPWSSSGRGIIPTEELQERHIRPWIRGIIRRQGCVLAETGADKAIDFATEWGIVNGTVNFAGLSYFKISGRGKYQGNYNLPQQEIFNIIQSHTDVDLNCILAAQKKAIQNLIAPYYNGPLGIDMLIDRERNLRPCIEINLRRTMGHVALST